MHLKASKLFIRHQFWSTAALFGLDGLFFGLTSPTKVAAPTLFIGFLLVVASLYRVMQGVSKVLGWYGLRFGRHRQRFLRLTTGVIAGVIALQSIGELTARDLMVMLPLALVLYLYLSVTPALERGNDS